MRRTYFALFLLLSFNSLGKTQDDLQSPCPRLFVYEGKSPEPDRWYGIVTLLSDTDLAGVWFRIIFDRPSLQLGNWFGQVSTTDNKEYLIKNRNVHLKAHVPQTIRFFLKYNTAEPPPKLVSFRLNAKTLCPEGGIPETSTAPMELQTSSQLETTPKPVPVDETSNRPGGGNTFGQSPATSEDDDFFTSELYNLFNNVRPSQNNFNKEQSDNEICGKVVKINKRQKRQLYVYHNPYFTQNAYNVYTLQYYQEYLKQLYTYLNRIFETFGNVPSSNKKETDNDDLEDDYFLQARPRPLITYGQPTTEGEFPWHVALYHAKGIDLAYICGASLISKNYVITVAHCVTRRRSTSPLNPENLVVYLGKHYLKRFSNQGIQDRQIAEIFPHPQYNANTYLNDIALLKLGTPADYNDYVRPVCLWQESKELSSILHKTGSVVGWGFDQTGKVTEQLMKAEMPVVSQETCIFSFPDFYSRFTSQNTYCAGFRNGTSVCNGDSGGGMVFPKANSNQKNPVWQLRGLVSISVALQNQFKCDASHYVVFTDTAKYLDWIKNIIK